MSDYTKYTKQEMQAYAIAKNIKENQIVIVGTGLPLIGASLAKRAVCPSCHPIVESGLMDCSPVEVPRSVGDNRFMAHCAVQWPNIRFIGFEVDVSRAELMEGPGPEIIKLIREEIDPGQAFIKVPKD